MNSIRIASSCLIGLVIALWGSSAAAQEKAGPKLKVEVVLKEWFLPKADVQGPFWPRKEKGSGDIAYTDMASQSLGAKEPMEKVWRFYADKCGHKGKFPGQGAGVRDGTGNEKARYLMSFSGGSERNKAYRCTFAYNTDRYTVFVEVASGWDEPSTGVHVTVATR
jgi:hypothetical protein